MTKTDDNPYENKATAVKTNLDTNRNPYLTNLEKNFPNWIISDPNKTTETDKVAKGLYENVNNPSVNNQDQRDQIIDNDDFWGDRTPNSNGRIERLGARISKKNDDIGERLRLASPERAERIRGRHEKSMARMSENLGDEIKDNAKEGSFMAGAGGKAAGGAMAAMGELPGIINNLETDPRSRKEAGAKVMSMAASGATIGGSIVPGWGHAIGAVVGAGAGVASNAGWMDRMVAENDAKIRTERADATESRLKGYYNSKSMGELKAQRNLMRKASGYSAIS